MKKIDVLFVVNGITTRNTLHKRYATKHTNAPCFRTEECLYLPKKRLTEVFKECFDMKLSVRPQARVPDRTAEHFLLVEEFPVTVTPAWCDARNRSRIRQLVRCGPRLDRDSSAHERNATGEYTSQESRGRQEHKTRQYPPRVHAEPVRNRCTTAGLRRRVC